MTEQEIQIGRDLLELSLGGHISGLLYTAYYSDKLTASAKAQVAEHLASCQVCGVAEAALVQIGNR